MPIALVRVFFVMVVLAGSAGAAMAAEPVGPVCITLDKFDDKFEMFLLPNGTNQFLLTLRGVNYPNTYAGSAALDGGELRIGFSSTNPGGGALISFETTLNLGTLSGPGQCAIVAIPPPTAGCGTGTALVFTAAPGPCP